MKLPIKRIFRIIISPILILLLIAGYLLVFHANRSNVGIDLRDLDKDGIIERFDEDIDNDGTANFKDSDADNDGIENLEDIINNSRKMKGTLYEYLKGKYNNIGAELGFLVCYDIPRNSYLNAGLSIDLLLKQDYQINKIHYNSENGINEPNTDFFFRRTRNLYSYCKANNRLIKNCLNPKPGDVIFHSRFHISLIIKVNDDGTINEVETAPWTVFAKEHKNRPWKNHDIGRLL